MSIFLSLVQRDLQRALASGAGLPMIFILLVATLYPFAIGPDGTVLARTGGGVLWVAALLAALLPIDRLIAPDVENGVFDQLIVRGLSPELIIAAKWCAHWLSFGPALLLACMPAAALLRLESATFWQLEFGLLLGTPALAALGVLVASLTAGLQRAGALSGLLLLPLAIPVLIFGAGSLGENLSALKLLAASTLFICAITPFAAGAALRALNE